MTSPTDPQNSPRRCTAILWGCLLTLCVTGYTFGRSNHHVYLLDALRFSNPDLLTRDWFTTHTLQYHYLFTLLTVGLTKLHVLHAGFFVLYLGLVLAMHVAWWSIVRSLGGRAGMYLLSVVIYHLSGGGLGLGVYQILQDGSFLPSNIAAVATLGALACWLANKSIWWPALLCAVAGLFHVNYAMACLAAWCGLSAFKLLQQRSIAPLRDWRTWVATAIAVGPCAYTMFIALRAADENGASIPIAEFFAVYVHLRHSHHHEPLAWPIALWISFLWPIPFALYALWQSHYSRVAQCVAVVLATLLALQAIAFLFAGVWYVSETLVKLSLFRFSPFAKLLTCVLAAWQFTEGSPYVARRLPLVFGVTGVVLVCAIGSHSYWPATVPRPTPGFVALSGALLVWLGVQAVRKRDSASLFGSATNLALLAIAIVYFAAKQQLGVTMPGEDDASMRHVCEWAKGNTPTSALFLVPPHDQSFTLAAQRAEVVSFKHVPQLSAEIVEWKRRLDDVLHMDVTKLPTPMQQTMDAMAARYASLDGTYLLGVARRYGCDYVIAMSQLPGLRPAYQNGRYIVYPVDAEPPIP